MKNTNLYGLREFSKINLSYDIETGKIVNTNGCDLSKDVIEISEERSFLIPSYISVNGIPFFPRKYEFINTGGIIYSSIFPPNECITIHDDEPFNEKTRTKQKTITLKDLDLYDVIGRKRNPSQNSIMKQSAKEHVNKLIDNGILKISTGIASRIQWHWCHFVSFRMLPTEKAQKSSNLFCGTSACNGHMTNIEAAVKKFIKEFKRPLALEVRVTTYDNSLVGKRIRYRIYDKQGSKISHSEYFDALTDIRTDTLDFYTIYNRLLKNFTFKKSPTYNNGSPTAQPIKLD